jgi:hypothetical protein
MPATAVSRSSTLVRSTRDSSSSPARLEQVALAAPGIDAAVGDTLTAARQRFEDALPA